MNNQVTHQKFPESSIRRIMALQQLFYDKSLTSETITQLINSYVNAIQYFDSIEPSIKIYFLEKIQVVLSRPEVINVLNGFNNGNSQNVQQKINNIRQTLRGTVDIQFQQFQKIQNPVFISTKKVTAENLEYNQQKKKKQRTVKAQMYMNLQNEIKQLTPQFRQQYSRLQQYHQKKQQELKEILQTQNQDLEKRLQKRRGKKKIIARKSLDKKEIEQESLPIINKTELKQIQKQIRENVERFTIRNTIRQLNEKGMKKKKVKIHEEQQSGYHQKMTETHNINDAPKKKSRITIRKGDDDDY